MRCADYGIPHNGSETQGSGHMKNRDHRAMMDTPHDRVFRLLPLPAMSTRTGELGCGFLRRVRAATAVLPLVCACLLFHLMGCASTRRPPSTALSSSIEPRETFTLSAAGLEDFANRLHAYCASDTGNPPAWPGLRLENDSSEKSNPFRLLRTVLRQSDCTAFRPRPATYEACRALHASASTLILLVIDYEPGEKDIVDKDIIQSGGLALQENLVPRLRLRVIRDIRTLGSTYELICHDNERVTGLARERCVGQVYPAETTDGQQTYHQVAGVFCVSRQTLPSQKHYIDEWFELMPYEFERPTLDPSW